MRRQHGAAGEDSMRASTISYAVRFSGLVALGAFTLAGTGCAGRVAPERTGTQGQAISEDDVPVLPSPTLAVPAGNRLAFDLDAVGVQIYTCKAVATGYAWSFVAPEANLYQGGEVVAIHYAGPTWQWLEDGSTVVGAKLAAFTVDPTAIPWLLLGAASHGGEGRMSNVTYVQRLETAGGVAPASGCDATTVGTTARVDYTAKYFFYRADNQDGAGE
jgi:hypothetical protein